MSLCSSCASDCQTFDVQAETFHTRCLPQNYFNNFFAFSVKVVCLQWKMKLLLYPCKNFFCFPTVNHRCEFLTPEEPFLAQMCLLLSLKKIHPDVKASKSSSRDLPGLFSSQCWFQSIREWSRTCVQAPHGCRSSPGG